MQELSSKLETALEQNRVLKRDIANSSDASRRAASLQEKMGQIRRQLRGNQEELKMLRDTHDRALEEKALLAQELEQADRRLRHAEGADLDRERGFGYGGGRGSGSGGSSGKLREQVDQQQALIRSLRQQLKEVEGGRGGGRSDERALISADNADLRTQVVQLRRENDRLNDQVRSACGWLFVWSNLISPCMCFLLQVRGGGASGSGSTGQLLGDNRRLQAENRKLKEELSVSVFGTPTLQLYWHTWLMAPFFCNNRPST